MPTIEQLVRDVATARNRYLHHIAAVTELQARWKPDPETWSITEVTEHLFWAEQGGILGMWKTLHAIREGSIPATHDSIHKGLPIEQIIERTWQPKEQVPPVAAPRLGGPLAFWKLSLAGLQDLLLAFSHDLKEPELRLQAHPHPISGALDFQQRIEFLRFHINRHQEQVARLLQMQAISSYA